jgi:hypothetical protein
LPEPLTSFFSHGLTSDGSENERDRCGCSTVLTRSFLATPPTPERICESPASAERLNEAGWWTRRTGRLQRLVESWIKGGGGNMAEQTLQSPRTCVSGVHFRSLVVYSAAVCPQKNASFAGGLGSTMTFNCRCQEHWHSAESAESDLKVCLRLRRAA